MKNRSWPFIVSIFLFSLAQSSYAAVASGDKAPDFSLQGHDGRQYKLSDFKNRHVVLEWYNDECPYVEKHYGSSNMQGLQEKYTKAGVVWFTINSSAPGKQGHADKEKALALIKKRGAKQTAMLLDSDGLVGRLYGAKTTPHMYVIDSKGILVYQGAIDDQPSANPNSLKGANPWFANALDASLAGKKVPSPATKPYGCSVKY